MGYMHISNLYQPHAQTILLFKECYALEKIHGTSATIGWQHESQKVTHFAGGSSYEVFIKIFDNEQLRTRFIELFPSDDVVVYGEAHGGKTLRMSKTYGIEARFVAFDVQVGNIWLAVPNAHDVCSKLGVEFVAYEKVSTDLAALNDERDRDSRQAMRNGMGAGHKQEGIVLRPLVELTTSNGNRVMAKHKRDEYGETKTPRQVSPEAAQSLTDAEAIATEWVTPMRLLHVLQKLPANLGMESTREVIAAMVADVYREGAGEVVESPEASKAIGRKAVKLFKEQLKAVLKE